MKALIILLSALCLKVTFTSAQEADTIFLQKILESHPEYFQHILNHPDKNQVQILYTQIDRDQSNKPTFTSYSYRVDPNWYFYPASTVKLPTVIFALEKLNELNIPGLNKFTWLEIDSAFDKQTKVTKDLTSTSGKPSLAHYIKKSLLVSDNDAHNRLFEFVGRNRLNRRLQETGAKNSRIVNRLAVGDSGIHSKHSNPFYFYNESGEVIYKQEPQFDSLDYDFPNLNHVIQGQAYMNDQDEIIHEPWSFEKLNVFSIEDQQLILKKLLFPESFPEPERFNLTQEDYEFIYYYMSRFPQEVESPAYDKEDYWPTYSKFIYFGRDKSLSPNGTIRSFNKYGDSYGYNIDNSYIVDFENNIEFLLTVVVQSNENGVYNDGIYEYETVTYPFLKNLGKTIYQYELKRQKKIHPDLSKFKLRGFKEVLN